MSKRVFSLHDSLFNNNTQLEVQFEPGGLYCEKWKNNNVTGRVLNKDDMLRCVFTNLPPVYIPAPVHLSAKRRPRMLFVWRDSAGTILRTEFGLLCYYGESRSPLCLCTGIQSKSPSIFACKNYHLSTKQCENNWDFYDKNRPVKNKLQQPCTLVMEHKRRNIELH